MADYEVGCGCRPALEGEKEAWRNLILSNLSSRTRMGISIRTAQTHLAHVYAKLDISSRSQLVQAAALRSA